MKTLKNLVEYLQDHPLDKPRAGYWKDSNGYRAMVTSEDKEVLYKTSKEGSVYLSPAAAVNGAKTIIENVVQSGVALPIFESDDSEEIGMDKLVAYLKKNPDADLKPSAKAYDYEDEESGEKVKRYRSIILDGDKVVYNKNTHSKEKDSAVNNGKFIVGFAKSLAKGEDPE